MITQKIEFIPRISKTSKMPCGSFSLPAQECKTGSILAKIAGSVCHGCYALKGNYRFPNVKKPRYENLELINDLPAFERHMIDHLQKNEKSGYFRWHDSGDLQSIDHLKSIVFIAACLPHIKFWLPTKEKQILNEYKRQGGNFPDNLIVRLSMPMINMPPTDTEFLTSTVHTDQPIGTECNAYNQGGKCNECRACWNAEIKNISYKKH